MPCPFEEFHENGQLRLRGNIIDGKLEGLSELFHENGQLEYRSNFIDGEFDGLHEEFDEDGNLTRTQTWENGVLVETK